METFGIWVVLALFGTIILMIMIHRITKVNNMKYLSNIFGSQEDLDLESYYYDTIDVVLKYQSQDEIIDKQTSHDLDILTVFKRINRGLSSIGDEYLYGWLHRQKALEFADEFEEKINHYKKNESSRLQNQLAFLSIGRKRNNGLYEFLNEPIKYHQGKLGLKVVQGVLAVIALLMVFIKPDIGITMITIVFIINLSTYFGMKKTTERNYALLKHYVRMVKAVKKMDPLTLDEETKNALSHLSSITLYDTFLTETDFSDMTGLSFISTTLSAYFMTHVISYEKIFQAAKAYQKESLILYNKIGYEEMCISVASYRSTVAHYTTPTFHDKDYVLFNHLYHPLLKNPVSYSKQLDHNVLLTGSNASGKSTFVKALALNTVLAKTINTALANELVIRPYVVQTSMAITDDLETGDSYFVAEIKSIQKILKRVQSNEHVMVIIDEVLKGTNTIERIAASSAVLKELAGHQSFVCAASHDIELTRILESFYTNYHFRETVDDKGVHFDYVLHDGPSSSKNAIKLLETLGYPAEVVSNAQHYASLFESNNQWPII
ncbi:MutS-related protein [Erysipelothrix urinaevulpis]|uniref:MutS-related protein n=1 Tax=Erysipelothrix urinaevulpis TaxID=2683717 RepID=UPI001359AB2B|nr:AAA family ATPase [Erysipelothrix urinaevulpis]